MHSAIIKSHLPLLISGETGTGKSFLAKKIFKDYQSFFHSFYQVNVAALNPQLFESELFGHKKGAFTGADRDKIGFCEKVGSGILFLDEIGELSSEQQVKLLTLIEERIFYPVGSTEAKPFRGKFIFATNKNLEAMVARGEFREDLYFRIRFYQVELLPLKDDQLQKQLMDCVTAYKLILDEKVWEQMLAYSWPGNKRELFQTFEYLKLLKKEFIRSEDLPKWLRIQKEQVNFNGQYKQAMGEFEKQFLLQAMRRYQGKVNLTSEKIGLNKVTLISKLKKYDIDRRQYKLNMDSVIGF
ncbi:MAG: hypothetical protein CME62_02770 [Halobacteriovoraceae bacterium]|nr:hypothetical protein [Halobacteriovoraceae bacterium]|tara:strand:- start:4803 stop:5696 length:894 start_codon:yes stop_codon:yes gene_type:complete